MPARRSTTALGAVLVALAIGVAACGGSSHSGSNAASSKSADVTPAGDIPDTQAFVEFRSPDGKYAVKVPEGWARTDLPTGATFTEKLNSIRIEDRPAPSAPTAASVRSSDVPALQAASRRFHLTSVKTVHRTAGDFVVVKYQAEGPADPVTGKRRTQDVEIYELSKDGTLVTITLTSPHGADNVDPWRIVTNSFKWTP